MFFSFLLYGFVVSAFGDSAFETHEVSGLLSPNCLRNYFKIFLVKSQPIRNYNYYHEVVSREEIEKTGRDEHLDYDDIKEEVGYLRPIQKRDVEISWRIVGGKQVSIKRLPYQILYGMYCGGALVAPEWAITAAHCKEKETVIRVGSTRRSKTIPYRICVHFTHPRWNDKLKEHAHDYDYQLLLLETPVPITPQTRPIAIGEMEDIKPGVKIIVSGWGHTMKKVRKMEDILRRVSVPIIPNIICRNMPLENYRNVTPRMFCAGDIEKGNRDACQGDSGGPAMLNGKLVGLVSFGVGCAVDHQPGVYSNLPLVRDWLRSVTGLPL